MIALFAAVAALCTAWLAGDALLGIVVAPQLFGHAETEGVGKAFAGLVFGDVLSRWVAISGLVCVIPSVVMLAAAAGRSLKREGLKAAGLPLAAALLVLAGHVATATMVDHGRSIAQELREHPDPVRAEEFRTSFHARSLIVISAEMLAALGVAIGCVVAAWRTGRTRVRQAGAAPR